MMMLMMIRMRIMMVVELEICDGNYVDDDGDDKQF